MKKTRRGSATRVWCSRGIDKPCTHRVPCNLIDVDAEMNVLVGAETDDIPEEQDEQDEEEMQLPQTIEIPLLVMLKEEDVRVVDGVMMDDQGLPVVDDEEDIWLDDASNVEEEFDVWHHIVGEIKEHAVRETALNIKRLVALKSMPHKNAVECKRCFHSDMSHCVSGTELLFSQRIYSKIVEEDAKKEKRAKKEERDRKKELDVVRRVGTSGIVILEKVISDRPKFQESREYEILSVLQHIEDSYIPSPPPVDDYLLHTKWSVVGADTEKIKFMRLKNKTKVI